MTEIRHLLNFGLFFFKMNEKKKKILFVITKSNWGGAQKYVYDLATVLKGKGYSVKVALGGKGTLFDKLKESGIDTVSIPSFNRDVDLLSEIKTTAKLFEIIRSFRPDVVHLNSSKAGLGALASRMLRVKKIVFTLHGLALHEDRSRIQKFIIKQLYRLTILFCHRTIVVSNALKNEVATMFPRLAKKMVLVHNGLLIPEFMGRKEARDLLISTIPNGKSTIDIPTASMVIGTIGELHPIKGHKYLIEGFREVLYKSALPLFLFIISDGEERKERQKQIDSLRLTNNVFLCGRIDDAIRVLKAFDIFILPSLSEGLPYAVQEAGLASLPVIATEVGGIPELIENNKTGILIRPKSSVDITHSILEVIYDPELRKSLGSSLHKKIKEDFNVDHMTISTENIYNS